MNVSELKTKNQVELTEKLTELLKNQFDLRMAKGHGQMTKVHHLKELRRDIARVKTILRQNEIASKAAGSK
jgi:large subunit ribosomal protein L29